jgi:hypothetical protein
VSSFSLAALHFFNSGNGQIVEEQLSFPSGTATAQLISVLHQLPSPDTSIHRRRGYRELDTEGEDSIAEESTSSNFRNVSPPGFREREATLYEGWRDLVWSFSASSVMTVSDSQHLNGVMSETGPRLLHIFCPSFSTFRSLEII